VISFTAYPATMITKDDSVRFNWKISGKPTLLFYLDSSASAAPLACPAFCADAAGAGANDFVAAAN
jgi:hypothetical protein